MHAERNPREQMQHRRREAVRAYGAMNTLRALERLAHRSHTTVELAESLQVTTRTARRLLERLEAEGYATREGGRRPRYRATLRVAGVGRQVATRSALVRAAAKRMVPIATATGCTADLWVPGADAIVSVLRAEPPRWVRTAANAGHVPSVAPDGALARVFREPHLISGLHASGQGGGVAAAAVLQSGVAVAALGVTGLGAGAGLEVVAREAQAVTRRLAEALRSQP